MAIWLNLRGKIGIDVQTRKLDELRTGSQIEMMW
jgi:hypothetical protein